MIYFGQEVGEPAKDDTGYGSSSRTSIFDYVGVPHHQRWVNGKKYDGGQLSAEETDLRNFYTRLLNFTVSSEALMGAYQDIHYYNREHTENYNHRVLSYVRWNAAEKLIIVSNFDAEESYGFELKIPDEIIQKWGLKSGIHELKDELTGAIKTLNIENGSGRIPMAINPLESFIFAVK